MEIIGLTGGIASGKSAACDAIRKHFPQVPVIDADEIAHAVLAQREEEVVRAFPECVAGDTARLDRGLLAREVFAAKWKRRRLERILHPAIKRRVFALLAWHWATGATLVVVDVPLLFELRWNRWVRTVVVHSEPGTQLRRLMAERGLTAAEARARMDAQARTRSSPDVVIVNEGSLADLQARVVEQMNILLARHNRPLHLLLYWALPVAALVALLIAAAARRRQ